MMMVLSKFRGVNTTYPETVAFGRAFTDAHPTDDGLSFPVDGLTVELVVRAVAIPHQARLAPPSIITPHYDAPAVEKHLDAVDF